MTIQEQYKLARAIYAEAGVDTDAAIKRVDDVAVSIQCWQGDDVGGFENMDTGLTGGIQATGKYPGKARNVDELLQDMDMALSMIPGKSKVNIHAMYLDNKGRNIDRNLITTDVYDTWADWAIHKNIGLDFNPTFFSHPKSDGYTLSSGDKDVRDFWVEHGKRSRKVGEYLGKRTGQTCINNIWVPDGEKENPYNSMEPRERLADSLDQILEEPIDSKYNKDAVESKLFGIGSEAYVVGSHDFYMGYVMSRKNALLTMDQGHYHPTESVAKKISAAMVFLPEILLHVSRPVRWDSDHIVLVDDELKLLMQEIVRCNVLDRVNIALDYFDASVNRVAAWVIGARNTRKALLGAMLEPHDKLRDAEQNDNKTRRMLLEHENENMPLGLVWNYYCYTKGIPTGDELISGIKSYEDRVKR